MISGIKSTLFGSLNILLNAVYYNEYDSKIMWGDDAMTSNKTADDANQPAAAGYLNYLEA